MENNKPDFVFDFKITFSDVAPWVLLDIKDTALQIADSMECSVTYCTGGVSRNVYIDDQAGLAQNIARTGASKQAAMFTSIPLPDEDEDIPEASTESMLFMTVACKSDERSTRLMTDVMRYVSEKGVKINTFSFNIKKPVPSHSGGSLMNFSK